MTLIKIHLELKSVLLWIYVLFTCFYSYSYFAWNTYDNYIFSLFLNIMSQIGILSLLCVRIYNKRNILKVDITTFFIILLMFALEIHSDIFGFLSNSTFTINDIRMIFSVFLLLGLDQKTKVTIFKYFIYAFTFLCLPACIYYIINLLGVDLPYTILESANANKVASGIYYKHFPLGVIVTSNWQSDRFCGIFDEPGVVGTLSALLIAVGYKKIHKIIIFLLFVEGLFSFSMAFYLMMIIFVVIKAFQNGLLKLAFVLIIILLAFGLFINMKFDNPQLVSLQERIDVTSRFLIVDNRTTELFDIEFQKFISDGGYPLLMGHGGTGAYAENPRMSGSCSYKCILYDFGIVGTSILLSMFILVIKQLGINKESIPFLLVFVISLYQRPYVYDIFFITLLVSALSFLRSYSENIEGIKIDGE